ncbi:molecular chaperone DnaJ [Thalassospira sp. TSL5-1]|uniref:molecular chaperone DnaJ n=1 Tax=Thalassospira sp. TSL5-1 TaxID=1544451 RepID=UPI0009388D35|nr:molecular chaperone DnaJ [Thalassospira sp. TSL5-1]OKH87007.1 molecular chaperone DnaJ [Thalassospira sp. TSL5-1]
MQWVILGFGLFVATGFLVRWLANAKPSDIRYIGFGLIALVLVLLGLWLLLTGKLAAMFAALVAAIPFLFRVLKFGLIWPFFKRMFGAARYQGRGTHQNGTGRGGARKGRFSEIRTQFLVMQLEHETGRLSGSVISGSLTGQDLDGLGLDALQHLYVECCSAQDQSRTVLETYLDRRSDCQDWRNWDCVGRAQGSSSRQEQQGGSSGSRSEGMDVTEARKILGLGENPSRAEINRAYQTLIKAVHPDHGGSDYLASRVNAARQLLLKNCGD